MTSPESQASCRRPVLMPASVDAAFDYRVPASAVPGTLVEAVLAGKTRIGAVWDGAGDPSLPDAKVKPVARALDLPPLPANFRRWLDWIADYTLAPRGAVLSLAGLAHAAKTPKKPYVCPAYLPQLPELTPAQAGVAQQIISCFKAAGSRVLDSSSPGGRRLGGGGEPPAPCVAPPPQPSPARGEGAQRPMVLDGVTGSGKTEVYFHAIAEAIAQGGQVLVLVPEIALTHQWVERFKRTFGGAPALWHSKTTPVARARVWQGVARGEAKVVVGARSALFLPFNKLALIIVDEEHDGSYKQDDGVLYHARDMAVVRAKFESVPILLVSATPSLETLQNMADGKYEALHLPQRFGAAGMPGVQRIDLLNDTPERGEFLSPTLKQAMLHTLAQGEQSLLFLNRRGYAPLLLCRACGHRFQCGDCSAWLVVHGRGSRLECHHCGHHEKMPPACPQCQAGPEKLAPCGPGVERIAEEVRAMFAHHSSPLKGEVGRGTQPATTLPLPVIREHARALRKNMTDVEKKLWQALRKSGLGERMRKQHPIGPYIADFACPERRLLIELDGGQHAQEPQIARDAAREEFLQAQGWEVLRFWNHEILENLDGVLQVIGEHLAKASPPPDLPLQGGGVRIAVLSSDENIAQEAWEAIERGEVDILIGTQMVAKGHHFPKLTLVGVVDADIGLQGADLRAGEKTYQLLHQLGGRAGRGDRPGTVLIQTYQPNHPVMEALERHDRDAVMQLEIDARREGHWPPFGQLAAILLDGVDEAKVRQAGQALARSAPADARLRVLGPAPAPLSKLRGQYRYRLLVKAQKGIHLQATLKAWLAGQKFSGVRVKLDVNPYDFM